jgi:long-subunit acyl-CoA synthetase (AMP-forming)
VSIDKVIPLKYQILIQENCRSIFGIAAAGGVNVAANYRLKKEDITYIFEYAKVDSIIVDKEYLDLLSDFQARNPDVPFVIDTDTDSTSGSLSGPFDQAVLEGLKWDKEQGSYGWGGLNAQADDEDSCIAIPFTSGTTARPKGVVYTHRGAYLAAVANIVESGLNYHTGRCGYLWTLPMFHAMGWSMYSLLYSSQMRTEEASDLPLSGYLLQPILSSLLSTDYLKHFPGL